MPCASPDTLSWASKSATGYGVGAPCETRHISVEQEIVAGEMITTVATVRATHQQPFLGIPATGTQVSFVVIGLDRIVDGRIVEHWALPDFFSLLQQIGGAIVPGGDELEWR